MKTNELLVVGKASFKSSKTGKDCYMLSVVHPDPNGGLRADNSFVNQQLFVEIDCTTPVLCEASYAYGGAISALKVVRKVDL